MTNKDEYKTEIKILKKFKNYYLHSNDSAIFL